MRDRLLLVRPAPRRAPLSVDVALFTPHGGRLTVLLTRSADPRAKDRWELPWDTIREGETLEDASARLAASMLGAPPAWLEQLGAFADRRRHPGAAEVSIAWVGLAAEGTPAPLGGNQAWFPADDLTGLAPRHAAMVQDALRALRLRVDYAPVAFRLLPPLFTLSELQEIYELLLGRRIHKASFRRALHAAWLVEPTDEWRSEGRGRPAQLFRYAPRKRRGSRRGVRFEGLGG